MRPTDGASSATTEARPCRDLHDTTAADLPCREPRLRTHLAMTCTSGHRPRKEHSMYQAQHYELARQGVEQRQRTQRVRGIRRSARLIQIEIRRSRETGHQE